MEYSEIIKKQRELYDTNITKDVSFRIKILEKLKKAIIQNEEKINKALKEDLNKSAFESYMCETGMVLAEITHTLKNIKKWTKTKKVRTPISQMPSTSYIIPESYGITLVISPWNYPFLLSFEPVVSAIAAGNLVVLKPSEYSENTTKVIKEIINETFNKEYIVVIEGGPEETEKLLNENFDYIFYTGSTEVGKIVMEKAAKNLTPVTLELGGKSPCIVDETANIEMAAKRIVFGKLLNAGQTCVAPDYILVHSTKKEELVKNIQKYITIFLGKDAINNEDYPKIINEKHFNRLVNLIEKDRVIFGGKTSKETLKIEPTLIDNVSISSSIMQEEIFGPLLPIITFKSLEECIKIIKKKEKPLSLYLFTNSKLSKEKVLNEISFGGGCINDTVIHLASLNLGFGGVGKSGMGAYHGKFGFDTFTHYKSVLKKSNKVDLPMRYHKYTDSKLKVIKKFLK